MLDRNKARNLEINAGRHFINPNRDFTIDIINRGMALAIIGAVVLGINSRYHFIERAYDFLVNYFAYLN